MQSGTVRSPAERVAPRARPAAAKWLAGVGVLTRTRARAENAGTGATAGASGGIRSPQRGCAQSPSASAAA